MDRTVGFFSPLVFAGPAVLFLEDRAGVYYPALALTGLGQLLTLVVGDGLLLAAGLHEARGAPGYH